MKYMGSKSRIAKDIVPIIQKYLDDYKIDTYIEPFCGGCNVIDKIQCNTRIASDVNKYLIELLINRKSCMMNVERRITATISQNMNNGTSLE